MLRRLMYEDSSKHGKGEAVHQNVKGASGDGFFAPKRAAA
jgi:hypothetical protein